MIGSATETGTSFIRFDWRRSYRVQFLLGQLVLVYRFILFYFNFILIYAQLAAWLMVISKISAKQAFVKSFLNLSDELGSPQAAAL